MGVERETSFPLVDGGEAVGSEGAGVVAGGKVDESVGTEAHGSAVVAAFLALLGNGEDGFFRGEVELTIDDGEAAQVLPFEIARRVVEKDVLVLRKIGIESHADETVFLFVCHLELAEGGDGFCGGFISSQHSGDFDEVDVSIRTNFEMHRLWDSGVEGFNLETEGGRRFRAKKAGEEKEEAREELHGYQDGIHAEY